MPRHRRLPVGTAVLAVLSAVLTVVGSMLDYARAHFTLNGAPGYTHFISAWTSQKQVQSNTITGVQLHTPLFGAPLTVGAVLLLTGALLALLAARPGARLRQTAPLTVVAGAGVLVGTVSAVLLDFISRSAYQERAEDSSFTISTAAGFWLLLAAGVLALLTALLAVLPWRAPPQPDLDPDADQS
jgi:hypothetical protein